MSQDVNTFQEKKLVGKHKNIDILTLLFFEQSSQFSSPQRIISGIESIELFYNSLSTINNISSENLSIISCDSGSDKSFDFLGNAKIMEHVKELIIFLWGKIVFFKEFKFEKRIELVSQALPVFEKIKELEEKEAIDKETAGILKRDMTKGVEKFLKSGAMISEVDDHSFNDPRQLIAPEPKLLSAPIENGDLETGNDLEESIPKSNLDTSDNPLNNLSPDEFMKLKNLLDSSNQVATSGKSDTSGAPEEQDLENNDDSEEDLPDTEE